MLSADPHDSLPNSLLLLRAVDASADGLDAVEQPSSSPGAREWTGLSEEVAAAILGGSGAEKEKPRVSLLEVMEEGQRAFQEYLDGQQARAAAGGNAGGRRGTSSSRRPLSARPLSAPRRTPAAANRGNHGALRAEGCREMPWDAWDHRLPGSRRAGF